MDWNYTGYPTYIEAQTKLVCEQFVQKNYNRIKAPEHHYVTMAKHNSSAMHGYAYITLTAAYNNQTVK